MANDVISRWKIFAPDYQPIGNVSVGCVELSQAGQDALLAPVLPVIAEWRHRRWFIADSFVGREERSAVVAGNSRSTRRTCLLRDQVLIEITLAL